MYQQGMSLRSLLLWPLRSRMTDGPYTFLMRQGTSFLAPRDVSFELLWREVWVEEVYAQGGIQVSSGATVVDIGANIGLFSLWAATRFGAGRIIAVEPSARMCDFVRRNAARNQEPITVLQVACGGSDGRGILYTPGDEAKNTLGKRSSSTALRALAEVDVVTLGELFRRMNVGTCDLLKLDCEGSEYDILLKAPFEILKKVRQIAMEYHPGFSPGETPERLEAFLDSQGFRVSRRDLDNGQTGYLYAIRPRSEHNPAISH